MKFEHVTVSREGGLCRILLSGSALSTRESHELAVAARELVEDRSVRAVLLASSGDSFCSGASDDLDPLAPGIDPTPALAALRVPVIAVLHGEVRSVGVEIALTADLRVASPDTCLSMPDVAAGRLPAWGGTQRLPRVVGAGEALRMFLLAETVDAARAESIGLVHEVAADPSARAEEILATWLNRGPLAVEYAKEAVLAGAELPVLAGLALEADLNTLLQASSDRAEGLAAFLEKRSPRFTAR